MLSAWFWEWTLGKKLFAKTQFAFVKGQGTDQAIFMMANLIQLQIKNKKQKLYTAFMDLKKAFDSVLLWNLLYFFQLYMSILDLLKLFIGW